MEACIGAVWGMDSLAPPLLASREHTPRSAVEQAVRGRLARPPCAVAFSGGRDSSTVLAVAAAVARSHGLAPPIPVTNRFPLARTTDEGRWQEQVVRHLGLDDWVRLEWTDELDMLGPYGTRVLRRHGPLMPFNAHFLEPLLEYVRGGSLLTGIGGDELMAPSVRPVLSRLLFAGRRPRRRQVSELATEMAPRRLRTWVMAREVPIVGFRWLRPAARRHIARDYARDLARWPLRWDRSVRMLWRCRHLQCIRSTLHALGQAHDVRVGSPFLEPEVLSAYALSAGRAGPPERGTALVELVGDLLPEEVLRRKQKAAFDAPFFNVHARRFARSWSGRGMDAQLVDAEQLAAEWRSAEPSPNSYTLLQQAWLADNP